MEEQNKPGRYFQPIPAEYAYMADWAKETEQSLFEIDNAIETMPADQGPTYELRPPGFKSPPSLTREQKIEILTGQKQQIVTAFNIKIDKGLVNADPQTAKSVKNTLSYSIDTSNKFRDQNRDQLKVAKDQPKSLDQAQDISMVDLYNRQLGMVQIDAKQIAPEKEKQPERSSGKELSLSELFANTYDVTVPDEPNTAGEDIDKD